MFALTRHRLGLHRNPTDDRYSARRAGNPDRVFIWERDFPVALQQKPKGRVTKIVLDFLLDETEIAEFKSEIRSNLNGSLPVCVTFSKDSTEIHIIKQGKGSASLNAKSDKIASFLAKRIQFQYIPAVRTAKFASSIVEEIVASELFALERDPAFRQAVDAIRELQRPVLEGFSIRATDTLKAFLPSIRSVQFTVDDERRFKALRHNIDISVDDGNVTNLDSKGDGIQSIVALGLRRHALEESRNKSSYIFAIEEPEAHLHPDAIHELRSVIADLGDVDQILLTTHSPLLVNRDKIGSNIIVSSSKAEPATRIADIRNALGVRSYDNLVNAEVVLFVEGDDDKLAMRSILADRSDRLGAAISDGRLNIEPLDGAGSLSAKVGLFKGILCKVHCFVDNDQAGRNAIERAKLASIVGDGDYNLTIVAGRAEAEFEDLIDPLIYTDAVKARFGVDLSVTQPRNRNSKWSARMSDVFSQAGVPFDDSVKMRLKFTVAQAVSDQPATAIISHFEMIISTLVSRLETKLVTDN